MLTTCFIHETLSHVQVNDQALLPIKVLVQYNIDTTHAFSSLLCRVGPPLSDPCDSVPLSCFWVTQSLLQQNRFALLGFITLYFAHT